MVVSTLLIVIPDLRFFRDIYYVQLRTQYYRGRLLCFFYLPPSRVELNTLISVSGRVN